MCWVCFWVPWVIGEAVDCPLGGDFVMPWGALIYQNESDYHFQKHIIERLTDCLQSGDQQPDVLFNLAWYKKWLRAKAPEIAWLNTYHEKHVLGIIITTNRAVNPTPCNNLISNTLMSQIHMTLEFQFVTLREYHFVILFLMNWVWLHFAHTFIIKKFSFSKVLSKWPRVHDTFEKTC